MPYFFLIGRGETVLFHHAGDTIAEQNLKADIKSAVFPVYSSGCRRPAYGIAVQIVMPKVPGRRRLRFGIVKDFVGLEFFFIADCALFARTAVIKQLLDLQTAD